MILNPSIPLGPQGKGSACIAPLTMATLRPVSFNTTQPITGYILLYIPCSEYGCNTAGNSTGIREARFPATGGEQNLGPSLVHTVLVELDDGSLLPPTIMNSPNPGTVELTWSYPLTRGSALLVLNASQAYIVLDGIACSDKLEIPGCHPVKQSNRHKKCSFLVKCRHNIEAWSSLKPVIKESLLFRERANIEGVGCWVPVNIEKELMLRPIAIVLLVILATWMTRRHRTR
jgi:hypothetical protein